MLNVKKMLTKLAEKLAELNNSISGFVPVTLKGVSGALQYTKSANVVGVNLVIGNDTVFSGFNGLENIGTMPTDLRPKGDVTLTGTVRTAGAWASATYYPCVIFISSTSGTIEVRGSSNIANCRYLVVNGCYVI